MQTSFKTTLNCGACVSKVTPGLNRITGLENWSVDTNDPDKRLTVSISDSAVVTEIVAVVRQAGFDAIPHDEPGSGERGERSATGDKPIVSGISGLPAGGRDTATPLSPVSLATYWPLLLVLLYILGGTVLLQWDSPRWSWHQAMSSFMGLFFVGFAFFKLLNVSKFATAFASYDLIAARSTGYGLAYPFIELGLGLAYLFGKFPTATNLATILLMGIGLIGVVRAVRSRRAIQCACLGTAFNLPMSSVTIIENSSMVLMAAAMLFWPH
jgi:cation transport ATPase